MAYQIMTHGHSSNNGDIISSMGRIIRSDFIWREIIYITYESEAYNTEIALTSEVEKEKEITSEYDAQQTIISSIVQTQEIASSVQKTIALTVSIISQYTR